MKNAKIWVVWGDRGHPRSSETSLFDRAHMTSYSTLIETMRISCTVFELQRFFRRKWSILTQPTCICRPRRGWSRSNFAVNFGVRKLESRGYRAALFAWSYVLLFWYNTGVWHTHTHTHTDSHTTKAYTALSIASRGRTIWTDFHHLFARCRAISGAINPYICRQWYSFVHSIRGGVGCWAVSRRAFSHRPRWGLVRFPQRISPMSHGGRSRQCYIPFRNARAKSEGSQFWRLQQAPENNLVTMAMSLGLPQNLCESGNPRTYVYQRWNVGGDRSSSCWYIFREIDR